MLCNEAIEQINTLIDNVRLNAPSEPDPDESYTPTKPETWERTRHLLTSAIEKTSSDGTFPLPMAQIHFDGDGGVDVWWDPKDLTIPFTAAINIPCDPNDPITYFGRIRHSGEELNESSPHEIIRLFEWLIERKPVPTS